MNTCKNLCDAAYSRNLTEVQRLFSSSDRAEKKQAVIEAASAGCTQCLEYLLSKMDFDSLYDIRGACFMAAMASNYTDCIELLIPFWDHADRGSFINTAIYHDRIETLNFLIQKGWSEEHYNTALSFAARKGHVKCVKSLLPVANSKAECSRALWEATVGRHTECMELLYDYSDPHIALEVLRGRFPHKAKSYALLEDLIARKQREHLLDATKEQGCAFQIRKI